MCRKLVFVLLMMITASALADDPKARAIMEKVDAVEDGEHRHTEMQMILIDKNGNQRVREIKGFAMDKGKDVYNISFFLSPADVKGTGFLTYDYDDENKDDDQWLFLPALNKTKRIAASDKSGSFMGSDFNFSDMTSRNLSDYDFTLKKEMKVNGQDVWVIESVPRTQKVIDETGYKKSLLLVRKDNHFVIRAISWEATGNKMKYMEVKKLEKVDGIWTALELHMTSKIGKQTVHATVLKFNKVDYKAKTDESLFTLRRLEKGL